MPRGSKPGERRGGRKKGTPNKASAEFKAIRGDFCKSLIEDPAYLESLQKRVMTGKCAPALETLFWHYAKGKPAENVNVHHFDHANYLAGKTPDEDEAA